jgi:hypothetical protein
MDSYVLIGKADSLILMGHPICRYIDADVCDNRLFILNRAWAKKQQVNFLPVPVPHKPWVLQFPQAFYKCNRCKIN